MPMVIFSGTGHCDSLLGWSLPLSKLQLNTPDGVVGTSLYRRKILVLYALGRTGWVPPIAASWLAESEQRSSHRNTVCL